MTENKSLYIINRSVVAGADLQTPLKLINSPPFPPNLQNTFTPKP